MRVVKTKFEGLFILEPKVFEDERGFFLESYSKKALAQEGIHCEFVQDNHSKSVKHTLRGLHFQEWPGGQVKLIRATKGRILDVVVDIRPNSPTYLEHLKVELSDENNLQFFIPVGFAHGFVVLSNEAEVQYKCSNYYIPELEKGYRWDSPAFNIDWEVSNPILSERDQKTPIFKQI